MSTAPYTVAYEAKIYILARSDNRSYVNFLHFGKERGAKMKKDDIWKTLLIELLIKLSTLLLTRLCTRFDLPSPFCGNEPQD